MKENTELKNELEALAPRLAKLKARQPKPQPPAGYFQALPDQVLARIGEEEWMREESPARTRTRPWAQAISEWLDAWQWLFVPRYRLALATVAVALVVGGILLLNPRPSAQLQAVQLSQISKDEALQYIERNIDNFDTELLLESGLVSDEQGEFFHTELDDSDIDSYLQENLQDLDESTLETFF
jgi:hypothetical protein